MSGFKDSLVYNVSSRMARGTQRNAVWKKHKRKKKKKLGRGFKVPQSTAVVKARLTFGTPPGFLPRLCMGKPRKLQF